MGRQEFINELQGLDYDPQDLGENRVAFRYTVPVGRLAGQEVSLGFLVADDFPANPPSGPHVSPRLFPLNSRADPHPNGGVHTSPFGDDWEYWSRPFPNWSDTNRSVRTYMAHVRHLFDTL